jgi:hypothetical protein
MALFILLIKFPASLITIPLLPVSNRSIYLSPQCVRVRLTIQRTGSHHLLVYCKAAEMTSLTGLAIGLNYDLPGLSALALVSFILAFGIGTGPVTWVVLSEVLPPAARTAGGSVGISLNAITSFVVSASFIPLQEWLEGEADKDGERSGEGNVFFVFAAFCLVSLLAVRWSFRRYEQAILEA